MKKRSYARALPEQKVETQDVELSGANISASCLPPAGVRVHVGGPEFLLNTKTVENISISMRQLPRMDDEKLSSIDLYSEILASELTNNPDLSLRPALQRLAGKLRIAAERAFTSTPKKATWSDLDSRGGRNPAQFIREYYKDELPTLTRTALQGLDPALAIAYATWIHRHPEDNLNLPTQRYLRRHSGEVSLPSLPVNKLSPEEQERIRAYRAKKAQERRARERAQRKKIDP